MKKNYLLLALFLIAALATTNLRQVNSKIPAPPVGSSGDAFSNVSCAQSGCHAGPANTNTSNLSLYITEGTSLDTLLTSAFEYVPGATYNMNFQLASTTGRYGFQISALNSAAAQAGTFAVTDATNTSIQNVQGRQYLGHKNAGAFKNWQFEWTAPASGDVTFYYAYNTADNDGEVSNDVIYKGSVTVSAKTGVGINDISNKLSNLNVFPNPVTNQFGVSFNLKATEQVQVQLYTLSGALVSELMNEQITSGSLTRNFDINNLAEGIYTMKLSVGGSTVSKKIVKQ